MEATSDEEREAWTKANRESIHWTRFFASLLLFIVMIPIGVVIYAHRSLDLYSSAGWGFGAAFLGFLVIVILVSKTNFIGRTEQTKR